jgi:hypothetical protein
MTGREGGRTAISDIWIDFIASCLKNMTIEKLTSKVIFFLEIPMIIYNRDSSPTLGLKKNIKLVLIQTLAISQIFNFWYKAMRKVLLYCI